MSDNCIFCKIVAGEIPCASVYEDEQTLAFMDIGPLVKGHALVIPKAHHETIHTIPTDLLAAVAASTQIVANAMLAGLGAEGVNVLLANGAVAGQEVPHLHYHIVPRFAGDTYPLKWNALKYDDMAEMGALAERIKRGISEA